MVNAILLCFWIICCFGSYIVFVKYKSKSQNEIERARFDNARAGLNDVLGEIKLLRANKEYFGMLVTVFCWLIISYVKFKWSNPVGKADTVFTLGTGSVIGTYVGGVERGERNLTILSTLKLCRALDVELCDLVEGVKSA